MRDLIGLPQRFGCQLRVSCVHCTTTALLCLRFRSSCRERFPLDTFRMLSIFFTAPASVSLLLTKERTLSTFSCSPPPGFSRPCLDANSAFTVAAFASTSPIASYVFLQIIPISFLATWISEFPPSEHWAFFLSFFPSSSSKIFRNGTLCILFRCTCHLCIGPSSSTSNDLLPFFFFSFLSFSPHLSVRKNLNMTDDGLRRSWKFACSLHLSRDGRTDGCLCGWRWDGMACAPFCVVLALFLGWVWASCPEFGRCGEVVENARMLHTRLFCFPF